VIAKNAGALHPFAVRQVAHTSAVFCTKYESALEQLGTTATPLARYRTSSGMPLFGAAHDLMQDLGRMIHPVGRCFA
jgi:hypothetical protein